MHIITGPVGNGVCDSSHPCSIAVNNASALTASNTKILPISFSSSQGLRNPLPDGRTGAWVWTLRYVRS